MMGSSSWNQSNTTYTNTPITQENVENPFNLTLSNTGSGTKINSSDSNISVGGSLSVIDGGAVKDAFDFGTKMVQIVADITRQNNASANAAATGDTKAAATGETKTATAIDWTKYKTELMIGAGILAWWFLGRKKWLK